MALDWIPADGRRRIGRPHKTWRLAEIRFGDDGCGLE